MTFRFNFEDQQSFLAALHIARRLRAYYPRSVDEVLWDHLLRAADGLVLNLASAWQGDAIAPGNALTCAVKVHVMLQLSELEDREQLIETLRGVGSDLENLRRAADDRFTPLGGAIVG